MGLLSKERKQISSSMSITLIEKGGKYFLLELFTCAVYSFSLTLILLFTTTPTFANSVDPDQMASEEAIWSGSTPFVIEFVNLNKKRYMM